MHAFLENHPMMLFAMEAGAALLLLCFIVAWTLSGAKKHPRQTVRPAKMAGSAQRDAQPPQASA